jgi:ribosomal-protein-alanine N-acetyltransferase
MNQIVETSRMFLSPVAKNDVEELHRLWAQPAVRKYLCDDSIWPLSQIEEIVAQSIAAFEENRYGIWIAKLKHSPAIAGFTGYWTFFEPPEIQLIYGLAPDLWGQGLATEMARAMLDYGFKTYGFEIIRASADVPNVASIAVMKRLGMTFDRQIAKDGQELVFYQISSSIDR